MTNTLRIYKFLTRGDRQKIAMWHLENERPCDIAKWLKVHTATIYNELQRGQNGELDKNQRLAYDPELAQRNLQKNFKCRGRRSYKEKQSSKNK